MSVLSTIHALMEDAETLMGATPALVRVVTRWIRQPADA